MIDSKHANIGATVSLLLNAHKLSKGSELPESLAELFTMESVNCDYRSGDEISSFCNHDRISVECIIGNCPLGKIVEKTSSEGGWPSPTEFMTSQSPETRKKMGFDATIDDQRSVRRNWWNDFKGLFRRT